MKRLQGPYGSFAGARIPLISSLLVLIWLGPASADVLAEPSRKMAECAKIGDDPERLKCYDKLAGGKSEDIGLAAEMAQKTPERNEGKGSYFSRLWELDPENRRWKFPVRPYRSNYILPLTYNDSPNVDVVRQADPDKELKNAEVKFQLSFKVKLWEDIFGKEMDLWFGYTQQSFWQLYNFEDSSPFRETNYEPELLLNFRTDYSLLGFKGRFINVGFNHQSNGQSEPLSRSWNRLVASVGLERGPFSLLVKGWYRIPEKAEDDDNPHMGKYLGYGEIWGYYFLNKHRFGVMLRNNLDSHTNRGALQLEWSFPLFQWVSGYVQYYVGYGESLLDYNHSVNRIGIGFILVDWQ